VHRNRRKTSQMNRFDYYSDRKFCPTCNTYVPYLMSIDQSYCVHCGSAVRLFSQQDWDHFHTNLAAKRPKGGRPRKNNRESA
jgi:hypothetical protein